MDNQFVIGQATDPGVRRRSKPNQDSIGFVSSFEGGDKAPLLILADGMGGYKGGEIASSLAVDTIAERYRTAATDVIDYPKLLRECIDKAHAAIREKASENEQLASMGSTVVLAALGPDTVHIANVGDSRAFLITANQKIQQISYDHSFVMELVRAGNITADEALHHPRRNVLTMSLNANRDSIDPFITDISWKKGDTVLICSDGLWGCVTESQIANVVTSMTPQEACEKLIKMANMNQGPDNISVLIAHNGEGEDLVTEKTSTTSSSLPITGDSLPIIQLKSPAAGSKKILAVGVGIILVLAGIFIAVKLGRNQRVPTITPITQTQATSTDIVIPTSTTVTTDTVESTATSIPTDTARTITTAVPTDTVEFTATADPTDTVEPTATSVSTDTVEFIATAVPTNKIEHTATVVPTNRAEPTATADPTDTVEPTATSVSTDTVKFIATAVPTNKIEHTATVVPTNTAEPTATAVPTDTVKFIATAVPTNKIEHTATVVPTNTAEPTATTVPTNKIEHTATVVPTYTVEATATTVLPNTAEPTVSTVPTDTVEPTSTTIPTDTAAPIITEVPTDTTKPTVVAIPTFTIQINPMIHTHFVRKEELFTAY